ncbi:hypothetical protein [Saccharothrix variisporea]|uniref:Small secreted domain DUF320 n=1 Tax=Saccharothrix variisporea TaxID=543527 RepID=A0A495X9T3_9PSEU|nr:hypothetical protein [Saccharothrix variisporea]RKT70717.1 hypothetical protein DFJ66_3987 [Saccharothrix variisporea]
MLKKVGALAAITAGMLLTASPAFAGEPGSDDIDRVVGSARDVDVDHTDQVGLVNIDDSDILNQINVCEIDAVQLVNVDLDLVPIGSDTCSNEEVDVEVENDEHHHHHWDHD